MIKISTICEILLFSFINLVGYSFIKNPYIYFIGVVLWTYLFYLLIKFKVIK